MAIGIAAMMLVTLTSGVTISLRNLQFARNKTLAAKYAQEGVEAVRSIRDNSWVLLTNGAHGLSWNGSQWIFSGNSDVITTQFTRSVTIADGSTSEIKQITVAVSWQESGGPRNVTLTTILVKY